MATYRILSALLCHRYERNGGDYNLFGAGFASLETTSFPAAGPLAAAVTSARVDDHSFSPNESASITVDMRYPDGSSRAMGEHTFIEADNPVAIRPVVLTLVVDLEFVAHEPGLHQVIASISAGEAPLALPFVVRPLGWS